MNLKHNLPNLFHSKDARAPFTKWIQNTKEDLSRVYSK